MYAITGATGKVGKLIANELLANGKNVISIGRNADKLESLIVKGALPFVGDLHDAGFVKKAFEGATAVFCINPVNLLSHEPRKDQQTIARNYVNAVKENDIKYVLLLSSLGAHLRNGAGVIDGLADMEVYFSELKNVNVLTLRCTYFMENILSQITTIKQMGLMGSPIKGDLKIPMVAVKDIAAIATKHLINLDFKGHAVDYILGPEDISYNEVARIIGKAIGRPDLKYVQFSYENAKSAMVQSGSFSKEVAELFNTMSDGFNNGKITGEHVRTLQNSTPTGMEEFAKTFAEAFAPSVLVE